MAEDALLHRALDVIRGEFEPRTWQAFWRTAVDGRAAGGRRRRAGDDRRARCAWRSRACCTACGRNWATCRRRSAPLQLERSPVTP